MATKRGTTPIITITVDGETLAGCRVYVTIEDSAGTQITKNSNQAAVTKTIIYDEDGNATGCSISMGLTQEETLSLEVGTAQIQLTWIDAYGNTEKSEISTMMIDRTLLEDVIVYA